MSNVKNFTLLYINFFIYSLCSVLAKLAGKYSLFSIQSVILYFLSILVLGFYAILWQHILKQTQLTIAYSNKVVTIIFGVMWGAFLFGEEIKWNMILGITIIICGIVFLVKSYE